MKTEGILLIIIAALIPLIWFVPLTATYGTAAMFSQYAGSVSLILMGITQLLATRIRGIEALFGSLDRVYVLHKWLAIGALVGAFLHGQIDPEAGKIALVGGLSDLAEDVAEIGQNALIVLIIISLLSFIPYKYWKWSHRLIGLPFAALAFHYIFIQKPFTVFDPVGLYISAFCLMGILSYLYLLVPRRLGHNSGNYNVVNVAQHGEITEINLVPLSKGIKHHAGQFTFVNFDSSSLKEIHPYTISSAPATDGQLRFLVKGLGSYTKRLGMLKAGSTARVSKAYGHFGLRKTKGVQVWIGGGIGITPFLSWAQSLDEAWSVPTRLYYCVRSAESAIYLAELQATAERVDSFDATVVNSSKETRLDAGRIVKELAGDIKSAHVYFCGPAPMRDALKHDLVAQGLRERNFHYEEFEIRTGVGLERPLLWAWNKVMARI